MGALKKEFNEQRDLFNDPSESGRILPFNGQSFFTLNRIENKRLQQKVYKLNQLEYVLSKINKDRDTYMSQALFNRPCRRALHVGHITHAYVDLDLYKEAAFFESWMTKEQIAQNILYFCEDNNIIPPSAIISSGRGVYLKWYWSSPLPRQVAGKAVAVNKALVKLFQGWGADPACVDMSRILRVVGTINSKNNQPVELLHQLQANGQPVTYDFESFADEVLPYTMEEIKLFRQQAKDKAEQRQQVLLLSQERAKRQQIQGNRKAFNKYDWCWKVVEDLRTLADLRYGGTIPYCDDSGHSVGPAIFGHIGASMLGHVIPSNQLWHEIQTWSGLILPSNYVKGELKAHSSTLLEKAKKGESYKYKSQTIIDKLQITSDEMAQLCCLIDKSEKRKRDREAWRQSHTGQSRAEYAASMLEGSEKLLKPWESLGMCRATYYSRKKKGLL